MSDNYSGYAQDVLEEFEKLKARFGEIEPAAPDLSKTMVVPRVEDIIEERPLKPAVEEFVFEEPQTEENSSNFEYKEVSVAAAQPVLSRTAKKAAEKAAPKAKETKEAKVKKEKKPKKEKGEKKFSIKKLILILIAFCMIVGIAVAAFVAITVSKAPKINPDNIYELLSENSIIYDVNGNIVDNIFAGDDGLRTNLEYNEIPKDLIDCFVSIEDKTFWTHKGFNIIRIFGAIWQKVSGQSDRIGGTSTITQQLARNLFLADIKSDRDIRRKIIEA